MKIKQINTSFHFVYGVIIGILICSVMGQTSSNTSTPTQARYGNGVNLNALSADERARHIARINNADPVRVVAMDGVLDVRIVK